MLWSFWRGVNSLVEQARASDKIENNNIINTMLPAEMLQRIFRLIQIISSYINLMGHSCKIGNAPNLVGGKAKSVLEVCSTHVC